MRIKNHSKNLSLPVVKILLNRLAILCVVYQHYQTLTRAIPLIILKILLIAAFSRCLQSPGTQHLGLDNCHIERG